MNMLQNKVFKAAKMAKFAATSALSVWKSGYKTGKRPQLDRDQDWLGPQIDRTDQDCNRGPVYGPSHFWNSEDRAKTGLDQSELVFWD